LLATHSSVFVSPASIQYVSRVFSRDQKSDIVRLDNEALPDKKHLFSIVNSQNNERIFFTDKVILVEGISDRLFFAKVFSIMMPDLAQSATYEVVSVGGKGFFEAYRSVLEACHVEYVIIADLDYVVNIGDEAVKRMFAVDPGSIRKDVIENPTSVDGASMVSRLEEAISTSNVFDLTALWEYIKSRRRKLRSNLSAEEQATLQAFLQDCQKRGVFILKRGDLESYLPEGHRSKDLDKLIRLLDEAELLEKLPRDAREELENVARLVFSKKLGKSECVQ
jgi:putative ATP-dependent endonuclease of OLD family